MPPYRTAWRWILILLVCVGFSTPPTWSQYLPRPEIQRHLNRAMDDVLRRRVVPDAVTQDRIRNALRHSFLPGDGLLDRRQALNRFDKALKDDDLILGRNSDGTVFDLKRYQDSGSLGKKRNLLTDYDSEATLEPSRQLLDGVFSDIRLFSILEHIDPATSKELDHFQLWNYLKDSANVPDYNTVAASFDSSAPVRVVTFETQVTLLRVYGGDSFATGRYYFCCIWRAASVFGPPGPGWSDASGLATPPGNLANHLSATNIPAGTEVIIGTVADNFAGELGLAKVGGNIQIFIPHVRDFPYEEYHLKNKRLTSLLGTSVSAREIVVQSDDRILRFRK